MSLALWESFWQGFCPQEFSAARHAGKSMRSSRSVSCPVLPFRCTIRPREFLGLLLRAAFTVVAIWSAVASLMAQRIVYLARSSSLPMLGIANAIKLYPINPFFRAALVEWPMLNPTHPAVAIEGINFFLRHDPYSPDAIRLRMNYESQLGLSDAARSDAQTLQKMMLAAHTANAFEEP